MTTAASTPDTRAVAARPLLTRLVQGAVGGLIAGAVFIGVTMWFASTQGDPAQAPLLMISTILLGADAMREGTSNAALGTAIHALLSAVYGVGFALAVPWFRTEGRIALAATLYGVALYLLNFFILSPAAFPVFRMANQPFELVVHALFGTLLGFAFYGRARQPPQASPH